MSRKPEKKKRKLPSEREKDSNRPDDDNELQIGPSSKGRKRKKDHAHHQRHTKEEKKSDRDDIHSSRQIKKPVYKKEPLKKSGPLHSQKESCSSTAGTSQDIKAVEKEQSKPVKTSCAATLNQKTEKTWEDKSDERCSKGSYSESKQKRSHKLQASEHENNRQHLGGKRGSVREPSKSLDDCTNASNKECASPDHKNFPKRRCEERVQNSSETPQSNKNNTMDAKPVTVKSEAPSRPSTSEKYPEKWRSIPSTPEKNKSASPAAEQPASTPKRIDPLKFVPFKFRIPRKVQARPAQSSDGNNNAASSNQKLKLKDNKGRSGVVEKKDEKTTKQPCRDLAGPSDSPNKEQKETSPLSDQLSDHSPAKEANFEQSFDQGQVAQELHLARSEKRLEVNVMQSYGELTAMDIDAPDEGQAERHSREPKQKTLILVLDTNVLLSHLDYVKKIRSCGLEAVGFPVVLIPWVVLQELDSLKHRKGLSGSVAHLATPAITFIYNSLKQRDPHLWGQSMQQATQISNGLKTENNDDRVLQCCLQYQNMYPECALILCTNDKNLSSKALLSGVKALSKAELEAEVRSLRSPLWSHFQHVSSPASATICTPIQLPVQNSHNVSVAFKEKGEAEKKCLWEIRTCELNVFTSHPSIKTEAGWELSVYVCELEDCLRDVLSEVLENEMKAAYGDLWLEIVHRKPPWSLQDVLQCIKKHWIAVFGHIVPRKLSKTVANLINFFGSGETVSPLAFLQETKELVEAFGKSSKLVPNAITLIENILNKLQIQSKGSQEQELSASDVVMKDEDDADKQPASVHVSPQEVWAVFENIWSQMYQTSLEVFKALSFDPSTMQGTSPMGRPPPPQDAVACLHRLSSMVSQLLQAFTRILSCNPGVDEVQTLLNIIYCNKFQLVSEDARLTTKDLLDCFSKPDYREKLSVGGKQLMDLQKALDGCIQTTGENFAFTTQY
ncbi:transcriptional protein SWT1 [Cyprinodon tularosa]|uniref:transcriptional protein SWT1 n=1 Tax=Cyprinodon tularosa TaxID=77115 RepID=UPI0018E266CE|nr:transcriptional protein SWT1 [Cyprinodon tularosa]